MTARTAALVGAAGGVGATRLTVECGAALAAAGHDVALLDAAFDTQGLARHVPGRLDPDLTDLLLDPERPLDDALVELDAGVDGRLAAAPVHAPFERLARAKAADPAETLGDRVDEAAATHDAVLVDTPPVATNPAVGAVTAADRVALVSRPTPRGRDARSRAGGRLADVGADVSVAVANFAADEASPDADYAVPESDARTAADAPAVTDGGAFGGAVAALAGALVDEDLSGVVDRGALERARSRWT